MSAALLIEDTVRSYSLPRFQMPADDAIETPQDFDAALESACDLIARHTFLYGPSSPPVLQARSQLAQLVADEIDRVQRFEVSRRINAVSDALALAAKGLRGVA